MAEDLTDHLKERGIKVAYIHSEVDTLSEVTFSATCALGPMMFWWVSIYCAKAWIFPKSL